MAAGSGHSAADPLAQGRDQRASRNYRPDIDGLRALAVAPLLLGGILAGAATSRVGAPLTTMGCAVLGLLLTASIAPWVPRRVTP